MSQICSKCGKENDSDAKFCVSCGSLLTGQFSVPTNTDELSSSSKKKPKTSKKLLAKWKGLKRWKKVVICVVVAIMLFSYLTPNSGSTSTTAKSNDTAQTQTATESDTAQTETTTKSDTKQTETATESDTSTQAASDGSGTTTSSSSTSSDAAATTTKSNDATVKSLTKIMGKINGYGSDKKSVTVTLDASGNASVSYTATNPTNEEYLIDNCVSNYINFSRKAYKYDNVTVTTFDVKTAMVDSYGKESNDVIFSIQMTKDNFEKYNWDNLYDGILESMEPNCTVFYIHPGILSEIDTSKIFYEGKE